MGEQSVYELLLWVLLVVILACQGLIDIRERRIPNHLNLCLVIIAAAIAFVERGLSAWISLALAAAILGALSALVRLNLLGGGDAKMFPAVSVAFRPEYLPLFAVGVAIAGGVIGIMMMASAVLLGPHASREEKITVPYAVAIALGALITFLLKSQKLVNITL